MTTHPSATISSPTVRLSSPHVHPTPTRAQATKVLDSVFNLTMKVLSDQRAASVATHTVDDILQQVREMKIFAMRGAGVGVGLGGGGTAPAPSSS